MPIIPRAQQQVGLAPLPGVRVSGAPGLEAFGGGAPAQQAFGAAQGLAEQAAKIREDERRRADQLVLQDADNKLYDLETRLLHDPKTGAFTKRGRDAFAMPEQVLAEWERGEREIEKGLASDDQRAAFRRAADLRRRAAQRTLTDYVRGEQLRFDEETTSAAIENAENEATANYRDPDRVALAIARQRAAIVDQAGRNGMDAEVAKERTARAVSRTHAAVINRMLAAGEDLTAKQYANAHKDELGEHAARIDAALEEGSRRGTAWRLADAVFRDQRMAGTDEELTKYIEQTGEPIVTMAAKTEKEALERVRGDQRIQADPKLREMTEARVRQLWREKVEQEAQEQEAAFEAAWDEMQKTGALPDPDTLVNKLSARQQRVLEERAGELREGKVKAEDQRAWLQFSFLNRDELRALPLSKFVADYWMRLSGEHRDQAVKQYTDIRDPANAEKFQSGYTDKELVARALKSYEVGDWREGDDDEKILKNPSSARARAWADTYDMLQKGLQAYHAKTGENADDAEKMRILQDHFRGQTKVRVKGGAEKRFAELTKEELFTFEVIAEKMPRDERENARRRLKAVGKEYNDSTAARLLEARLLGDDDLYMRILER